ncbi:MAG: hypothetical protein OXG15_13490 [Gammaproteobacteria bacterium]|nr:hypothetical protein [Gammaproteobacteria bacterium]
MPSDPDTGLTSRASEFERAFEATFATCSVVNREEAEHFVAHGFVVVKGAFSKDHASHISEQAWRELKMVHGVDQDDPGTWARPGPGPGPAGYARLKGSDKQHRLQSLAPKALQAQFDLVGGAHRFPSNGEHLAWGEGVVSNLGVEDDPRWQAPAGRQPGWHKDGWHFRHFLNSPEQALVTVPIYTDIRPRSGGTYLAIDSIGPVARLLSDSPAGIHPDSVQGGGYLIPGLVDQCREFGELTGEAGDMALLHPYMLHRVSINPSTRPRFIANMAPVLSEPMKFDRAPSDQYSLVELATLHALGQSSCKFQQERPMKAFKPLPFRDEEEKRIEGEHLRDEMRVFAERGIVSPSWGQECGYMSNREFISN